MDKLVSIENFPLFERNRTVNTPLSLEACKREGIEPYELLHKPLEHFCTINKSQDVQTMYYNFFENKRKLLIKTVKRTRKQLAHEKVSRLSSNGSTTNRDSLYRSNQSSVLDKNVKSISRYLSAEALCVQDMINRQNEHIIHDQKVKKKLKLRSKEERKKFISKKMILEEKERILASTLEKEKKSMFKRFKDIEYDHEIDSYISKQTLKERELKKQEKDKIIEEHLKKKEEIMQKTKEDREQVINFKDFKIKQRNKMIKDQMTASQQFYYEKNKQKAQKRAEHEKKIEQEINQKKKMLQDKLLEESKKLAEISINEQKKVKARSRSQSQERLRIGTKANVIYDKNNKAKYEKYKKKYEEIQSRLSLNEELLQKNEEMHRHREFLKEFNKEYNLMRLKKIEDYEKEKVKSRLEQEEARVKEMNQLKEKFDKKRMNNSKRELTEREKMYEVVYNLQVTKNWKNPPVKKLLEINTAGNTRLSGFGAAYSQDAPYPKSR